MSSYPFIGARNYTPAKRGAIDLIVLHTMEAPEKPGTARAVAKWFAGPNAPRASCHFCVDATEVIQCVSLTDVAWHAAGANRNSIGIEHAGYAKQSEQDWCDEYSTVMLERSAALVAKLCRECSIPIVRVTATQLRAGGARGICGHVDVSKAFGKSTHWDPGPNFPWDEYLATVGRYYNNPSVPP